MTRTLPLLALATLVACADPHAAAGPGGPGSPSPDASVPEPVPGDAPHPTRTMVVTLAFDDTFADQLQGAAMLEAHGMRGTFYINSPRIGTSTYMTLAQIQGLVAKGHELGGHTLTHPSLTDVDLTTAQHEICDDRAALVAKGLTVATFAYPFGSSNANIEAIARQCGYSAARSVGGLYSAESCTSCPHANTLPPGDMFLIATPPSITPSVSLQELEGIVEQAESHGGTWLPLVFHHVCDACNPNSVRPSTLEGFLDWLEQRGTPVKPTADALSL
jgi:peptidoglycan/xylan/chitin deacetylase (PgdA/CDA1 family)